MESPGGRGVDLIMDLAGRAEPTRSEHDQIAKGMVVEESKRKEISSNTE